MEERRKFFYFTHTYIPNTDAFPAYYPVQKSLPETNSSSLDTCPSCHFRQSRVEFSHDSFDLIPETSRHAIPSRKISVNPVDFLLQSTSHQEVESISSEWSPNITFFVDCSGPPDHMRELVHVLQEEIKTLPRIVDLGLVLLYRGHFSVLTVHPQTLSPSFITISTIDDLEFTEMDDVPPIATLHSNLRNTVLFLPWYMREIFDDVISSLPQRPRSSLAPTSLIHSLHYLSSFISDPQHGICPQNCSFVLLLVTPSPFLSRDVSTALASHLANCCISVTAHCFGESWLEQDTTTFQQPIHGITPLYQLTNGQLFHLSSPIASANRDLFKIHIQTNLSASMSQQRNITITVHSSPGLEVVTHVPVSSEPVPDAFDPRFESSSFHSSTPTLTAPSFAALSSSSFTKFPVSNVLTYKPDASPFQTSNYALFSPLTNNALHPVHSSQPQSSFPQSVTFSPKVFSVVAADSSSSFPFTFRYTQPRLTQAITLQIKVESHAVFEEEEDPTQASETPPSFILIKSTRVFNLVLPLSTTPTITLHHLSAKTLFTHTLVTSPPGLPTIQAVVSLVRNLLIIYHKTINEDDWDGRSEVTQLDFHFSEMSTNLDGLVELAFALASHPSFWNPTISLTGFASMEQILSYARRLDPISIASLFTPQLSAWPDCENCDVHQLHLSASALNEMNECAYFLLQTLPSTILLGNTAVAKERTDPNPLDDSDSDAHLTWPPPTSSRLAKRFSEKYGKWDLIGNVIPHHSFLQVSSFVPPPSTCAATVLFNLLLSEDHLSISARPAHNIPRVIRDDTEGDGLTQFKRYLAQLVLSHLPI
ncbi:hypothetical protein BLNAU_12523 [Blattamonas nauphoetae]|uniref:Uncharacterized protein n=1 Tax=Blattamonas nauphoetae TaxID=2049346 RepID=A0ABQ9XPL9_9EUKA|nr:hypothetical protein BLNAU_12523 [Blattamonas nauphoetae]